MRAILLNKYYWLSFCGHLAFFAALVFMISPPLASTRPHATILKAYLYQLSPQKISRHGLIAKPLLKQATNTTQPHHETKYKKTNQNILLQILHEAIAAKQIYPENALALNQTGTVRFGFFLYPDGHLSHLSLLQSSGILSIDEAAKSAIFAASPIKETVSYLKSKTYFTIDVVFA